MLFSHGKQTKHFLKAQSDLLKKYIWWNKMCKCVTKFFLNVFSIFNRETCLALEHFQWTLLENLFSKKNKKTIYKQYVFPNLDKKEGAGLATQPYKNQVAMETVRRSSSHQQEDTRVLAVMSSASLFPHLQCVIVPSQSPYEDYA